MQIKYPTSFNICIVIKIHALNIMSIWIILL